MKFDTFLSTINGWGKYQKEKFIFVCVSYMIPPIMVYTWTFTAATPDFRCHHPLELLDTYNDTSNELFNELYRPTTNECRHHKKFLSLKECQRCYRKIQSSNNTAISKLQQCDKYVFDHRIYISTLVQEVQLFWSILLIIQLILVDNGM